MCYTVQSELETHSQYSPGIVKDAENLLRLGFCPEHIVNGKVVPAAISRTDLKERGFSVYREQYAEPDHLRALAAQQGGKLQGRTSQVQTPLLSVFSCNEVRKITFDEASEVAGTRAAIVIDDANEDNIAHAAIFSTSPRPRDIKWLRNRLLPLLNHLVALEAHLNRVHTA